MTAVMICASIEDESMRRLYVAPMAAIVYDVVANPNLLTLTKCPLFRSHQKRRILNIAQDFWKKFGSEIQIFFINCRKMFLFTKLAS